MSLVPYVVEQTSRGERSYDIFSRLLNDRIVFLGEEVNSIRDRRSNEILATVAMRAMDNTAKAPTQVIITALDSRSFAEYLNENSDILQAVLSKNNAMGRRA